MSFRARIITASAFTAVLLLLGVADALFAGSHLTLPSPITADVSDRAVDQTGVVRSEGASVEAILQQLQLTESTVSEKSLIERIVTDPTSVHTVALLKNGDRIALFSWIESPDVKDFFNALKDALHTSFSPAVTDLKDTMQYGPDGVAINILTFKDPAISAERLLFMRIRQRLYEFHIADGKDADVRPLTDALSQ